MKKNVDVQLPKIVLDAIRKLGYEQLHTLNHIIIERMKLFEKAKTISILKKFQMFDSVYFVHKNKKYEGVVVRLNQTKVTVKVEDGVLWKIPPEFLKKSNKTNIYKELMTEKPM